MGRCSCEIPAPTVSAVGAYTLRIKRTTSSTTGAISAFRLFIMSFIILPPVSLPLKGFGGKNSLLQIGTTTLPDMAGRPRRLPASEADTIEDNFIIKFRLARVTPKHDHDDCPGGSHQNESHNAGDHQTRNVVAMEESHS